MKAKVRKVTENGKKSYVFNGNTYYVHVVNLENDEIDYEYHSAKATCDAFVPQQEADFELSEKTSAYGTTHRIKPNRVQKPVSGFAGGGAKKFDNKDQGAITWLSCFSSVCVLNQGSSNINDFAKLLGQANAAFEEAMKHSTAK